MTATMAAAGTGAAAGGRGSELISHSTEWATGNKLPVARVGSEVVSEVVSALHGDQGSVVGARAREGMARRPPLAVPVVHREHDP
jgi:hypothetical protein